MLKFRRIDAATTILSHVIRWGVLLGLGRYAYLGVVVLAGKQTLAHIVLEFLANLRVSQTIAYLFGAGGIIYGVGERRLRQRNIERHSAQKNELERIIDPKRTSSNISERGTTRPGDKR
jgi:hypothetical protein